MSSQRHSLGSLSGVLVALFDVSSNWEVSLDSVQRAQVQCVTLVCQMVNHIPNEKILVLFWLIDCKLIKCLLKINFNWFINCKLFSLNRPTPDTDIAAVKIAAVYF